ncbi:MAG: hypothetical protein LQ342_004713 [Letrouitia transgressa]|nr:MAG: hypothetical protein LQ342_004713 [Letrouitia transgressa]
MNRASTPPILSELRSSTSPAIQVAALRSLKNEIIGHGQKKEMWIGLGVLEPLARILNSSKRSGKKPFRDANGLSHHPTAQEARSDEEEARLQAIIIIGILAHGGPAYLTPLNAAGVVSPLLAILSSYESAGHTVLATLRTLNTIADALCLDTQNTGYDHDGLYSQLYQERHLTSVLLLVSQSSRSSVVQEQITLAATLISKTCQEEKQRNQLVEIGFLAILASRLASFIRATGFAASSSPDAVLKWGQSDRHRLLAKSNLAPILECIGTILKDSRARSTQFLSLPAFASLAPKHEAENISSSGQNAVARDVYQPQSYGKRNTLPKPIDHLLPQLPGSHFRGTIPQSSNFPPLGVLGSAAKQPQSARTFSSALEEFQNQTLGSKEDTEIILIAWLIYIVRVGDSASRLTAAWVLGILHRNGFTGQQREVGYALLLIPILVRMLDKDSKMSSETRCYHNTQTQPLDWLIKQRAPCVLAMLTIDNVDLQRAAVDADAIKKLSQLLKESDEPLPPNSSALLWTPEPAQSDQKKTSRGITALGRNGFLPVALHAIKTREAVLVALTSLASLKDEYRKAIIGEGVVPIVIESLRTCKASGSLNTSNDSSDSKAQTPTALEYPTSVILAACGAARSLSRSVSTLRTSLMDAGLAKPLFILLKHPEVKVRIAATAVVCNLVLEFSPMREAILEAGVLKILGEHAHSEYSNLRLNAVWAFKHLVMTASKSLKIACLEELGPGWLKQIICHNSDDLALTCGFREREMSLETPITMESPNAAGEQVDLLNAVRVGTRESSQGTEDDDEDLRMADSIGALSRRESEYRHNTFHMHNDKSPTMQKTLDPDPWSQVNTDDSAVQKEGLDFIRNLICGPDAIEMIDYVFHELGQDKMFDILMSKLRPKLTNAFSRGRRTAEATTRQIQPQPEIVISVCYILVHLAAGLPRHRQLLISQTELLKLILPLFNHTHREIRGCCVWIVINLIWVDDKSDEQSCKSRARELMKLGFLEKLETLKSDEALDVKERTKTAIHYMSTSLGG